MALHLRYVSAAAAGAALLGLAAYAVCKSGVLRPVLVETIRGGMKAADWMGRKAVCVKQGVEDLVAEAKAAQKKPAAAKPGPAKAKARPAAAKAKATAKPAAKPTSAPAA